MSSIYDDMENLLRQHREREAQQQSDAATNERFDRIESAVTRMAESVEKLAKGTATDAPPVGSGEGDGRGAGNGDGDSSKPAPPPPEPPAPELPVERVTLSDVPRIYTGDDEPESVQYLDADDGTEKTRPGRRKGQPTRTQVELVPAEGDGE